MESNSLKIIKPTFNGQIEAKISQLGTIESNMTDVKLFVEQLKGYYQDVKFDENTLKEAKEEKAKINKFKTEVADYRKDIIKQWKEPVDNFEKSAKEVESLLTETYDIINNQVSAYDNQKKQEKENNLRDYFKELQESTRIDFVTFENANLNITLTATEKALKEQLRVFFDKIKTDLEIIDTMDNKIEILAEYKTNLDLKKSILVVSERKEREAEEIKRQQELAKQKEEESKTTTAENLSNEDEIIAPKEIKQEQEEEKKYTMTFKVSGTMEQLKELKEYLKERKLINE